MHCGKELSFNDIGAHKKFINRGSREFMCIECLAKELKVPEKLIYEKIEYCGAIITSNLRKAVTKTV